MSSTKIVILGKPGKAINGTDIFLEVSGEKVYGEFSLDINAAHDAVATATIKIILPEIEYRDKY